MAEAWPAKIEESQRHPYYSAGGVQYPRIRYGDEKPGWGMTPCHDCGVVKGQFHVLAECDSEQCPKCGKGISGHTCHFDEFGAEDANASRAVPTGWRLSRDAKIAIFFTLLLGVLAALSALEVF